MSDHPPLPAETCDALLALLRPPDGPAAAQALADALRRLLPEARAAYVSSAQYRACSPPDAPEGAHDGLVYRGAGAPFGDLGAAVPAELADAIQPRLQLAAALACAGWHAAAHRDAHLHELLTLAEAAGGLLHGLNNHLNGIVMHAAILQARAPEAAGERAEAIRRLGAEAARLAQPAQAVRPWPVEGRTACPYAALCEAWNEVGDEWFRIALAAPFAPVAASPAGLRRLFGLILRIARGVVGPGVDLEARFDAGPRFSLRLPGVKARDGEGEAALPPPATRFDELQRQAALWLAREQGSRLEVVSSEGGVELRLAWGAVTAAG